MIVSVAIASRRHRPLSFTWRRTEVTSISCQDMTCFETFRHRHHDRVDIAKWKCDEACHEFQRPSFILKRRVNDMELTFLS